MNDLDALAKLVQALEPWRAHLVFIGGWAHRLYRFCPGVNVPSYGPIITRDNGLSVCFVRISAVLEELAHSHAAGTFRSKLKKMAKYDLLIADDLGTQTLDAQGRADFFELIVARADHKSTIVTSQMPFSIWHGYLSGGNKTTGDATMDRLNNSLRLVIKGESMRRMKGVSTAETPENRDQVAHSPNA